MHSIDRVAFAIEGGSIIRSVSCYNTLLGWQLRPCILLSNISIDK